MQGLVRKPTHPMNSAQSRCQTDLPSRSRRTTTDFMLSVSTSSGTPMARKAWTIPMSRFSWRALGKNSTYELPQWCQTIAKHATPLSAPAGPTTVTKPQSIWYASPGPVLKRRPRLPCGATVLLLAGTRSMWAAT